MDSANDSSEQKDKDDGAGGGGELRLSLWG